MSLEQRSPEPDAKNKKNTRLQRGPFLASWLAKRTALETGEDVLEQQEDDVEVLDSDWKRFRSTWHVIFSKIKIPGMTKSTSTKPVRALPLIAQNGAATAVPAVATPVLPPTEEVSEVADEPPIEPVTEQKTAVEVDAEAVAVVSDQYKGELYVWHGQDDDTDEEAPVVDATPVIMVPQPAMPAKVEPAATPPNWLQLQEAVAKPIERKSPPMPTTDTTAMTIQPLAISNIVENRRPVDLSQADTLQKRREYLDAMLDKVDDQITERNNTMLSKARHERHIEPLTLSNPKIDLPALDSADIPEETPLELAGEQIDPQERAEEVSQEIKETPAAQSSHPTHVADILATSPLFNQSAPAIPAMAPRPMILPPVTQPVPPPITPDFSIASTPTITGALYRQAIKTGFWAGICVTFVWAVIYLVR